MFSEIAGKHNLAQKEFAVPCVRLNRHLAAIEVEHVLHDVHYSSSESFNPELSGCVSVQLLFLVCHSLLHYKIVVEKLAHAYAFKKKVAVYVQQHIYSVERCGGCVEVAFRCMYGVAELFVCLAVEICLHAFVGEWVVHPRGPVVYLNVQVGCDGEIDVMICRVTIVDIFLYIGQNFLH